MIQIAKDVSVQIRVLMPKSLIRIFFFLCKCEVEKRNLNEGVGQRRKREIKQKIVTTHGSSSVPLVLHHPGFLSEGILESFFWGNHLYTVQVPNIHRLVTGVPVTWGGTCMSSCFLSQSLSEWASFVWMC